MVPVLDVKNLLKRFPARSGWFSTEREQPYTAVDEISFAVEQGEIVGLLGPNGAGKTTTIHMLLSTLKPTSGSITYFGKDLAQERCAILQKVGFASTYVKLPPQLTIMENLDIYGRLYGLSRKEREYKIREHLHFFGIWHLRNRLVGYLSAGEVTRVMLAKSFLADPVIVLLDEPTASLDPDVAHEVRLFVLRQRDEHGTSFLITSHNMAEVTQICDRVLFLQRGKIMANNTPEELARSVSVTTVYLMVGDGLKRTISYAQQHGLQYEVEGRDIGIDIDEKQIAKLLTGLAQAGVEYSQISIEKPTLEDYFLQRVKKS